MNNIEPMQRPEQDIVEQKVRRAAGINALRKIGLIIAAEQQTDTDSARLLRWLARYGWIIFIGVVLLAVYAMGLI